MALSSREKAEAARYKPPKKKTTAKKKKVDMRSAREKAEASFIPKKTKRVTKSITSSLSPSKSVIPKINPKRKEGYFVDKKQGNKMIRVFPNIAPAGWKRMTDAERISKGFPTEKSKKYLVDYSKSKKLTFVIKK